MRALRRVASVDGVEPTDGSIDGSAERLGTILGVPVDRCEGNK